MSDNRRYGLMTNCAALAFAAALLLPCPTIAGGEIRTEAYGEGAVSGGSRALYWDIYAAEAGSGGQALVFLHGGGCQRGSRSNPGLVDLAMRLAQDGITVVSPDYRLLKDNPLPRQESITKMAGAASEIWRPRLEATEQGMEASAIRLQDRITACAAAAEDALNAWRTLKRRAPEFGLDPERIALGGSSAGAIASFVAAYELAGEDERPAAFVSLWGAAPGLDFTSGGPPLWALHGADDSIVTLASAEKTASRARHANVFAMLHVQQDGGHGWREVDLFEVAPGGKTRYDSLLEFLQH